MDSCLRGNDGSNTWQNAACASGSLTCFKRQETKRVPVTSLLPHRRHTGESRYPVTFPRLTKRRWIPCLPAGRAGQARNGRRKSQQTWNVILVIHMTSSETYCGSESVTSSRAKALISRYLAHSTHILPSLVPRGFPLFREAL